MKALILAGGKGTRLASITKGDIPKPMAEICGKPIIVYAIEKLKNYGIKDLFISVGYLHDVIQDYLKDGQDFGVNIEYIVENEPLGSGGAMYYLKDKVDDDFLVVPGDIIFDINFDKMIDFHKKNNALITLFTHPNLHPYDSDLVFVNKNNQVIELNRKNSIRDFYYKNNVNAGVFVMSNKILEYFKTLTKVNIEHDLVTNYIDSGRVFAYKSTEYIKDVGTPERFMLASRDIERGLVEKRNLKNKQKAIFIDRDGTINKYRGFIKTAEDIELIDGVIDAIKKINSSEYLAIVVSNQPVIARGEASFDEVDKMFNKIETLLGQEGAYLDGVYYCPHHPHSGYEGEIKELKIECNCRKPKIGMLEQACQEFNLDLSKCYMIGDTNLDVKTAINAGIKSIKVNSVVEELESVESTINAENLLQAVNMILKD